MCSCSKTSKQLKPAEIEERIKAERAREEAMKDLENEVFQRERTT